MLYGQYFVPPGAPTDWSRGILIAPRFGLGQDDACCDPPVFSAPGGQMSSLQAASALFIFGTSHVVQKKTATRKTPVANVFVQKEVCVQRCQLVSRFEVPRMYLTSQKIYSNGNSRF